MSQRMWQSVLVKIPTIRRSHQVEVSGFRYRLIVDVVVEAVHMR